VHWLLPSIATAASAAFAAAVLRQYGRRRRPYQLAWGISLSMFAVASLALAVGAAAGWTPPEVKVYYLFGAMLNVHWLALGTVLLLARRPGARRAYLAGLAAFTLASVALVVLARVGAADLAGQAVLECRRFLPPGVRVLAVLGNVAGTAVVVGGAVASGYALRRQRHLRTRFEGNLLIALGVLLAAGGGVFAFLDRSGKLAAGLALGAAVMYAGFRRASAPVPGTGAARPESRSMVTLYTRAGCHLCEAAEAVLRAEQAATPFALHAVDVDSSPELARRFGVRVPVVAVDGVELFEYEVPADLLRARLRTSGAV